MESVIEIGVPIEVFERRLVALDCKSRAWLCLCLWQAAGKQGSVMEVEGANLLLMPPFFPACIFLLRRFLSLLGSLAAPSFGALLPLLYDSLLLEAESPAAAASGCLQQQQHSPEAAAQQLSGLCMQVIVSLKDPEVLPLLLQHFPM